MTERPASGVSRRRLLGAAGVGAAVAGAAGAGVWAGRASAAGATHDHLQLPVPFRGERQAGIITAAQDRMHFATFDVTTDSKADLIAMLMDWTHMAERMTRGEEAAKDGAVGLNPYAPPSDTGEALGLAPSQLTLTIGFGPSLFDKDGKDRFGIAGKRPEPLRDLPKFPNETMDPGRTGGDICVQACANDPQVAVHAIRNLARVGFGTASVRYSQLGFGRTSSTTRDQATPRNLFGFKDGTNNIKSDETQVLDDNIWVADGDGPGSTSSSSDGGEVGMDDGMVMPICGDGIPQAGELCLMPGGSAPTGLGPADVGVGDFDGDGALDVVTLDADALDVVGGAGAQHADAVALLDVESDELAGFVTRAGTDGDGLSACGRGYPAPELSTITPSTTSATPATFDPVSDSS